MTEPATTVYFAPVNRLIFYAADRLRGSEVRLHEEDLRPAQYTGFTQCVGGTLTYDAEDP